MAWTYEPEGLVEILDQAGFDAFIYDNIEAVKDEGGINQQVYINPSGQLRFQYSSVTAESASTENYLGHPLSIDRQCRDITTIIYRLGKTEDLIQFLAHVPDVIRKDGNP